MEFFQVSVISLLVYIAIVASMRLSRDPSKQFNRISERLSAIETRLDEIDMKVDDLLPERDDGDFDLN
jgi:hypothetical protein